MDDKSNVKDYLSNISRTKRNTYIKYWNKQVKNYIVSRFL